MRRRKRVRRKDEEDMEGEIGKGEVNGKDVEKSELEG